MTDKKKDKQLVLHDLKANLKLENSVDYAIYNTLVNNEQDMLSNRALIDVLKAFFDWVENKKGMSRDDAKI